MSGKNRKKKMKKFQKPKRCRQLSQNLIHTVFQIFHMENWDIQPVVLQLLKIISGSKQLVSKFPLSMLILGQKACFLGPTIFEVPQPNWHYYLCYSIIVSSNGNSYCWYEADPASSWGSSKTNIVILGTQMCSCWLNNY